MPSPHEDSPVWVGVGPQSSGRGRLWRPVSITPLAQTLEDLLDELAQATFLKATLAGILVGSVRAQLREGTCAVGRLIVHPTHSHQGIGTRLMEANVLAAVLGDLCVRARLAPGLVAHGNDVKLLVRAPPGRHLSRKNRN